MHVLTNKKINAQGRSGVCRAIRRAVLVWAMTDAEKQITESRRPLVFIRCWNSGKTVTAKQTTLSRSKAMLSIFIPYGCENGKRFPPVKSGCKMFPMKRATAKSPVCLPSSCSTLAHDLTLHDLWNGSRDHVSCLDRSRIWFARDAALYGSHTFGYKVDLNT